MEDNGVMPQSITHVGFHLTSEVGANDALFKVRVVPVKRRGTIVFGRTLAHDEVDSGEAILLYPGDNLRFAAGSMSVSIEHIDGYSEPGPDGYAPVSNTICTWLQFGPTPDPALFRLLFATARRLDTAHALCTAVLEAVEDRLDESLIEARARIFEALGYAELMCVAFNRAIVMIDSLRVNFGIEITVPETVQTILVPLRELRHAFEHIDERAYGRVRGKSTQEALSIFDQEHLPEGKLRYGDHVLDLRTEVVPALVECRRFVFGIARHRSGGAISGGAAKLADT